MSKKNKAKSNKNRNSQKKKVFNWKKLIQKTSIALAFIGLALGTVFLYANNKKVEYDLSVIGNGTATVVQVHDPSCQLCRRLKSNLDSVKGDFTDDVQFKIANIRNQKGRAFASQYDVPHVTLVFFNERGDRVNTLNGVTPKEEIKSALTQLTQ